MTRAAAVISVVLFFFAPTFSAEARMNKCTDGKQITYTTEPCENTGLKPAGPIKDAVTVMPLMPKIQNADSAKQEKARDGGNDYGQEARMGNQDADAAMPKPPQIKPVNPIVNKMLNW